MNQLMCCPYKERNEWQGILSFPECWYYLAVMGNQTYGSGAFQQLLQAVPVTALVCAATIALLLLFVRILAQSLGSQHRQKQEDTPSRLHPGHFTHFQPREYDPYWMPPTFGSLGPARALDFLNSSPSSSLDASGFGSFNSSPRMPCRNNLTETLCIEVINPQTFNHSMLCLDLSGFVWA